MARTKRKRHKRRPGVKTGRPLKNLPEKRIARLAKIGASANLIAHIVGCDESTIRERFPDLVRGKDAEGKAELLAAQHKLAVSGDGRMLVHLGRHRLDQRDAPPDDALPDLPASGEYIVSLRRKGA